MRSTKKILKQYFDILDDYNARRIAAMPQAKTEYSEAYYSEINAMCDGSAARERSIGLKRALIIGIAAAVIIATVTACAYESIRKFFAEVFDKGTRYTLSETAEGEVRSFELRNLPDGFIEEEALGFEDYRIIKYKNADKRINFKYSRLEGGVSIGQDTEGAIKESVIVGDSLVELSLNKGRYSEIWHNGDYFFILTAPESIGREAMLRMIESVCELDSDNRSFDYK